MTNSHPPCSIELCSEITAFHSLAREWNPLLSAAPFGSIFQTHQWHQCWWKNFGAGRELFVLLARKEGQLVGIAPLLRENRVLRFIGTSNFASDYCDFLIHRDHPEALTALLEWIAARRGECWRRLDLFNLSSRSPHLPALEAFFRQAGCASVARRLYDAPTRVLGNEADDKKTLNKESIKRNLKHFRGLGELTFRHLEAEKDIQGALPLFFDQHIARWAATPFPSLFHDPREKSFYEDLTTAIAPLGWLRFSALELNRIPIAFHFGFEHGGSYLWYKPTFDPRLAKSPGEVLLKFSLEYAMEKGLREFDFTVGSESYKFRFSNETHSNHQLLVFHRSMDQKLYLLRRKLVAGVKALLEKARVLMKRKKT